MRKVDWDSIPHLVHCLLRNAALHHYTWWGRLAAHWWGIQLGESSTFQGHIRLWRHPGSQITIGKNCCFRASTNRPCFIQTLSEKATVTIGAGSGLNGVYVGCGKRIEIGRNVKCGADTTLWDTDFHPEDPRSGSDEPVIIGDNVWLGVNVTVLKGVIIGDNTVVGPGSLVMRSLPSGVIAMGVPARAVKKLDASCLEAMQSLEQK
ncbi:acyltransferase [Planctomycetota bacterium]